MPLEQHGRALSTWVGNFQAMKQALHELMAADLVICSACEQPATHIDFQDSAEWYAHCADHHYGFGEQWTGSTRFQAHHLWVAVYPEKVEAWLAALGVEERKRWHIEPYDTRDLYALIAEEDWGQDKRVVAQSGDHRAYVRIRPLTNGEYAYEVGYERPSVAHEYGLTGTFASADDALAHALQSEAMPGWAREQVRGAAAPGKAES